MAQGAATTLLRVPRWDERTAERHQRRRVRFERSLGVGVPVLLVTLWQIAATRSWIDARIYPSPLESVQAAIDLFRRGRMQEEVWVTARGVLVGFAAGSIVGFALGTVMGLVSSVRAALEPMLSGIYVVPKLALFPIFLSIFGYGDGSKLAVVATTVFFFVWIGSMGAMIRVPEGYREAARSFEVSRWKMFRHVLLPAVLPELFTSLRVAMGVAVLVRLSVEFIVGNSGLGYLIFNSRTLFLQDRMYAGIVMVALLGVALTFAVTFVGRRLTPWQTAGHTRDSRS